MFYNCGFNLDGVAMKIITLLVIGLLVTNPSFAQTKAEPYSQEVCQAIYGAIGTFLALADGQWKQKNDDKAMMYLTASTNYAAIYETVCSD